MAGNVGSDLSLDSLTDQLLQLIQSANVPEYTLGVATEGIGGSVFDPPFIYLHQQSHTEVAYEWEPATLCTVELVSPYSCVIVDNRNQYKILDAVGMRVEIKAGVHTKFSVISSTGQVILKVNEFPI